MRCPQVRRTFKYHGPNDFLSRKNMHIAHYLLLLFYPFRDNKKLLSCSPPLHQNRLLEPGVQTVGISNKN